MTPNVAFHTNNAECNPLFQKMQAVFCTEGTIADQMREKAAIYDRHARNASAAESHMHRANNLPKTAARVKNGRSFSLRSVTTACAAVLLLGTLACSGLALGSMRAPQPESMPIADLGTYIADSNAPTEADSLIGGIATDAAQAM